MPSIAKISFVTNFLMFAGMKEDDISELLRFDRKQLRARITILKNDKFLQGRLKMETGPDGKAAKVTYYFINYKTFVNVVKYKLDVMRKRMDKAEREQTNHSSYKCVSCHKAFDELDAEQLNDKTTGEWRCTFCGNIVEEDITALPQHNSRLMVARFNEQLEPLYGLLLAVENIKLSPECLEPEPIDIDTIRGTNKLQKGATNNGSEPWSGEATRNQGFAVEEARVDVSIGDVNPTEATKMKERPIWMTESTIVGADNSNDAANLHKAIQASAGTASRNRKETDDTLSILLQNEKQSNKSNTADAAVRSLATSANNSDSSDDEQIENAAIRMFPFFISFCP